MIVTGAQAQTDERARIGNGFRLPAMIGLVAAHGIFTLLIPGAGGFAG